MSERIRSMQIDIDKALEMEAEIDRLGAINVILEVKIRELEAETQRRSGQWVEAIGTLRAIGHAVGCEGDELAVLAAVRRMAGELATLKSHPDEIETTKLLAANTKIAKLIACVRAADLLMRLHSAPAIESLPGSYRTLREAYDAARAEIDK